MDHEWWNYRNTKDGCSRERWNRNTRPLQHWSRLKHIDALNARFEFVWQPKTILKSPFVDSRISKSSSNMHELAVFGYLRRKWRASQIDDHLFPPQYLIKIIAKFYTNEKIHLFGRYNAGGHWKNDVFDIISCLLFIKHIKISIAQLFTFYIKCDKRCIPQSFAS